MKKEHFSFCLGLFLFLAAIFASPSPVKQDFHDVQQAYTLSTTIHQMVPIEQQFDGNSLSQLLQRNWEIVKTPAPFASFYTYTKQLKPQLLQSFFFNQLMNGKVSLSIWVQCFRN